MRTRTATEAAGVRDAIPGGNQHELMMELFRTIDEASARLAIAMPDGDNVVKAINDLETRLESIEDALRRIHSVVREMAPQ